MQCIIILKIQDKLINHVRKDTRRSIFHVLAGIGSLDCIKYLISIEKNYTTKIDWYTKDAYGQTPLLGAFNVNQDETAIYLLENVYNNNNKLFNINDGDSTGRNALWLACLFGNLELVSKLLEVFLKDIDVNHRNNNGTAPLWVGM